MTDKPIEIKIENQEVNKKLLEIARKTENLRPLMKNIAGILAYTTEENFKNEGRTDKWIDLSDITKENRRKQNKYPGQILQVEGNLASSVI